ncbi:hypothetical protein MYX82_12515 [Acidobacteria bacterium AH-259-D05]|nr:hypothetical protein [Acidobacteria bacterium AH-259-D05]
MKLQLDDVSASQSGDYYQVLFQGEQDGEEAYLLVQRQFELPDLGRCYVETHDEDYVGHFKVAHAELARNRLFLRLARKKAVELEVTFNTTDENYQDVERVMRIMIPRLKVVGTKDAC